MSTVATQTVDTEGKLIQSFCDVVSDDLKLLASLNGNELSTDSILQLKTIDFPRHLGLLLSEPKAEPVLTTLNQTVKNWPDVLPKKTKDLLDMDFAGIYLNHAYRASPQESVWVDEENLAMQQSMFQVREFYKRYGLEVENWRIRPDDHLVTQLQLIAYVFSGEIKLGELKDIAQFLDEHLLRWVMSFAERAAMHCETAFYASLVLLTAFYLEELRDLLAKILDEPRPTAEEIEQRMKPKVESIIAPMKYMPGTQESW